MGTHTVYGESVPELKQEGRGQGTTFKRMTQPLWT